jgi:Co/Zn/Cd efflux system component
VLQIPGVIGFAEPHFWEHSPDRVVGTIRVQVQEQADEQTIRRQVTKIYQRMRVRDFVCQVEKLGL